MKKLFLSVATISFLISCGGKADEESKVEIVEEDSIKTKSLVIGDPLDCGLLGTLMFPIGTSYNPEVFEPPPEAESGTYTITSTDYIGASSNMSFALNSGGYFDKLAAVEYINNQGEDFDITNLLFYDIETGESYPLIDNDTLHIISFAIHKEFDNPLIFYRAVREDSNYDEKYNALDPVMLFASPLSGDTLIQITPDHEQFVDYFYYKENQKILAKTRIDADNDSLFTPADETNFVEVDLNNPTSGKPLFPTDLKEKLKGQINS